jgi:hypothetical protein
VLFRAKRFQLSGLVVGSLHPALRPWCERLALPVLVTEGIGHIPMAAPILHLLRAQHGCAAVLAGAGRGGPQESAGEPHGPEIIIPWGATLRSPWGATLRSPWGATTRSPGALPPSSQALFASPGAMRDYPQPSAAPHPLGVGARVRLTRPPYLGALGQVIALPPLLQETSIGTRAYGAEVRLTDGRKVFVPFVNLELLE